MSNPIPPFQPDAAAAAGAAFSSKPGVYACKIAGKWYEVALYGEDQKPRVLDDTIKGKFLERVTQAVEHNIRKITEASPTKKLYEMSGEGVYITLKNEGGLSGRVRVLPVFEPQKRSSHILPLAQDVPVVVGLQDEVLSALPENDRKVFVLASCARALPPIEELTALPFNEALDLVLSMPNIKEMLEQDPILQRALENVIDVKTKKALQLYSLGNAIQHAMPKVDPIFVAFILKGYVEHAFLDITSAARHYKLCEGGSPPININAFCRNLSQTHLSDERIVSLLAEITKKTKELPPEIIKHLPQEVQRELYIQYSTYPSSAFPSRTREDTLASLHYHLGRFPDLPPADAAVVPENKQRFLAAMMDCLKRHKPGDFSDQDKDLLTRLMNEWDTLLIEEDLYEELWKTLVEKMAVRVSSEGMRWERNPCNVPEVYCREGLFRALKSLVTTFPYSPEKYDEVTYFFGDHPPPFTRDFLNTLIENDPASVNRVDFFFREPYSIPGYCSKRELREIVRSPPVAHALAAAAPFWSCSIIRPGSDSSFYLNPLRPDIGFVKEFMRFDSEGAASRGPYLLDQIFSAIHYKDFFSDTLHTKDRALIASLPVNILKQLSPHIRNYIRIITEAVADPALKARLLLTDEQMSFEIDFDFIARFLERGGSLSAIEPVILDRIYPSVIQKLRQDGLEIAHLPVFDSEKYRDLAKIAVAQTGLALSCLKDHLNADPEIIEIAMNSNPLAFCFIDKDFQERHPEKYAEYRSRLEAHLRSPSPSPFQSLKKLDPATSYQVLLDKIKSDPLLSKVHAHILFLQNKPELRELSPQDKELFMLTSIFPSLLYSEYNEILYLLISDLSKRDLLPFQAAFFAEASFMAYNTFPAQVREDLDFLRNLLVLAEKGNLPLSSLGQLPQILQIAAAAPLAPTSATSGRSDSALSPEERINRTLVDSMREAYEVETETKDGPRFNSAYAALYLTLHPKARVEAMLLRSPKVDQAKVTEAKALLERLKTHPLFDAEAAARLII